MGRQPRPLVRGRILKLLFSPSFIPIHPIRKADMWLFTEEAATGITRTLMGYVYGFLLIQIPDIVSFAEGIGITQEAMVLILGTLVYTTIRAAAEKFPWLGYLLVFNKKPSYAGVVESVPVPPAQ